MMIRYLNHWWHTDMYKAKKIVIHLVEIMNLETASCILVLSWVCYIDCFIYKNNTRIDIIPTFKEKNKNSLFITTCAISFIGYIIPIDITFYLTTVHSHTGEDRVNTSRTHQIDY